MAIKNEKLRKALEALQGATMEKSLKFKKTGREIKAGLAKKIAECQAKIAVLEEIPGPAKSGGDVSEEVEASPKSPNQWRIDSLKSRIEGYETISRNLNDNQTYELDRWELTEYGL